MRKICYFGILLVPFLFIQSLNAQIARYIKPLASGTGTATDWANASDNLQAVIKASMPGDSIFVMKGVYVLTASIVMKEGVKMYGGFTSEGQVHLSQRVFGITRSDSTVLDGNNDKRVINNNFTAASTMTAASVLDGFLITNGRGVSDGGGMYNRYASPIVSNCIFSANVATRYGGGMHNLLSSSPIVSNCIFSKNIANNRGGGINNDASSSPAINNCSFSENAATTELGGGMFSYMSTPILNNCSFSKNKAVSGGGMYNFNSSPRISHCNFVENTTSQDGGGMYNDPGSPAIISNCTFSRNTAGYGGGGMVNGSSATITDCLFSDNVSTSGFGGGGMFNTSTSATKITNCSFVKNISNQSGGGIYQQLGSSTITNCKFLENSASHNGGGLFTMNSPTQVINSIFWKNISTVPGNSGGGAHNNNFAVPAAVPTFIGCSFWGNTASFGGGMSSLGASAKIRNCIIYGGLSGASGTPTPLVFNYTYSIVQGFSGGTNGNLAAPAGVNQVFVDVANGDFRLLSSSPAVNAANNTDIPSGLNADLAGNHRIANTTVDMGAYEFGSTALQVVFGNFSASLKNSILFINWTTLTETNNDFFDIEISEDGTSFTRLTSIKSKAPGGDSDIAIDYHFEIGVPDTAALVTAPFMFALCCLIRVRSNRMIAVAVTIFVLSGVLFSCSQKDILPEASFSKLYLRIAQTDKDGAKQYSKAIVVVRAD